MPTVYEVAVKASLIGKPHVNVFHVYDGDDNATLATIASAFNTEFVDAMLPLVSTSMQFTEISVKSITGANPGTYDLSIAKTGTNPDDPMPTGIHVNVKLNSDDQGFKAGNKLIGGFVETQFTGGEPSNALLNALQVVFDDFIPALISIAGVYLSIYRPSLSVPGFPQVSTTSSALVRGDSTNNRRRKDFERN